MGSVNPFLNFLFELRLGLKSGKSLMELMESSAGGSSDFEKDLSYWWELFQVNPQTKYVMRTNRRKILQSVLLLGFQGAPILAHLETIESDVKTELEQNRMDYNERLKFKLMIPLLLLVFPALLIIMLGPTLGQVYSGLLQ